MLESSTLGPIIVITVKLIALLFCGRESLASRVPYCQAGYFREWLPTAPYKLTNGDSYSCVD